MGMVNRKRFSLLTAWILAAALLAALGSDALAATGSRTWGRRLPSLGTQSPSTAQARKPGLRPYTGEPDQPGGAPQGTSKDAGSPSGAQLPYWQQVLQGLLPVLGSTRLP
jgi:hypothetical protein